MNKIWENIKHLPTTIMGIGLLAAAIPQLPQMQPIVQAFPGTTKYVVSVGGIGAGVAAIIGLGQGIFAQLKSQQQQPQK